MNMRLLAVLCLILLASCSNPPYGGRSQVGADEFVIDSYAIRQGKSSILNLEGKQSQPLAASYLQEYPDTIHEGDILHIGLYHPSRSDLSASLQTINNSFGFRVEEGKICLPDVEPIAVEGLTLGETRKKIQEKYGEGIKDVEVFLYYKDRPYEKVELAGLVEKSSVPVDGKMRLFEALSLAKVPTTANLFRSYVVRDTHLLSVDLARLLQEGDMSQNIVMRGGDKIYIADAAAACVMVLGEVVNPRTIDIPSGYMSLKQAITQAGGMSLTGDRSYIQVIRGSLVTPKIYTLSWKHVIGLPNESLLLMPGDIVYVAATPLAEWNRFVCQILPTLVGADLIGRGAKNVGVTLP